VGCHDQYINRVSARGALCGTTWESGRCGASGAPMSVYGCSNAPLLPDACNLLQQATQLLVDSKHALCASTSCGYAGHALPAGAAVVGSKLAAANCVGTLSTPRVSSCHSANNNVRHGGSWHPVLCACQHEPCNRWLRLSQQQHRALGHGAGWVQQCARGGYLSEIGW
jgi:hypothetical protein